MFYKGPGFILEFKKTILINKDLFKLCDVAIEQIKTKEYFEKLKRFGIKKIYAVGIAFRQKEVEMKYEILK